MIESSTNVGKVLAIAVRTAVRGPMREVSNADAASGAGLDGDVAVAPERGVTLLAAGQWNAVNRELRTNLPWHMRRANVLIDAESLQHLIGRTIRLGNARVRVNAETRPCQLMDELHSGLRQALTPECRGGVYGRIIEGGSISVGDQATLCD